MSGTEFFRYSSPINRSPKPTKNSPELRHPGRLQNEIKTPTPIIGRAMSASENLKPRIAINHAVVVVPRFAPIITPIASRNVSSPALTKLTTITVVTVELCTDIVTSVPEKSP